MFQSLNLFKSIHCPFYSAASNTLTCDRPHCQFKHPSLSSSSSLINATDVKQDVSNLILNTTQPKTNEPNSKQFKILHFQFFILKKHS